MHALDLEVLYASAQPPHSALQGASPCNLGTGNQESHLGQLAFSSSNLVGRTGRLHGATQEVGVHKGISSCAAIPSLGDTRGCAVGVSVGGSPLRPGIPLTVLRHVHLRIGEVHQGVGCSIWTPGCGIGILIVGERVGCDPQIPSRGVLLHVQIFVVGTGAGCNP